MNLKELRTKAKTLGIKSKNTWKKQKFIEEIAKVEDIGLGSSHEPKEEQQELFKIEKGSPKPKAIKKEEPKSNIMLVRNESRNLYVIGALEFKPNEPVEVDKRRITELELRKINRAIETKKFSAI